MRDIFSHALMAPYEVRLFFDQYFKKHVSFRADIILYDNIKLEEPEAIRIKLN